MYFFFKFLSRKIYVDFNIKLFVCGGDSNIGNGLDEILYPVIQNLHSFSCLNNIQIIELVRNTCQTGQTGLHFLPQLHQEDFSLKVCERSWVWRQERRKLVSQENTVEIIRPTGWLLVFSHSSAMLC